MLLQYPEWTASLGELPRFVIATGGSSAGSKLLEEMVSIRLDEIEVSCGCAEIGVCKEQ
jgi:hypothetical protein